MHAQDVPKPPVTVRLPAEIDLTTQERAYDQLYAAFASGGSVVIADLSATTFCDCAAMRRLMMARRRAAAQHADLRLVIPPGSPVLRLAHLTELDRHVPVYPSLGEAAAAGSRGEQASHAVRA